MKKALSLITVALVVLFTYLYSKGRPSYEFRPNSIRVPAASPVDDEWPHYGHDLGGSKYSPITTINRTNLSRLTPVWTFATGHLDRQRQTAKFQVAQTAFELTPIMRDRKLFICDPFNVVFALDATTGKQLWSYDPDINGDVSSEYICRGVSAWADPAPGGKTVCAREILEGTLDGRLIALDEDTGKPCSGFGKNGQISLKEGLGDIRTGEYWIGSPPTIVKDLVVVGAGIADNWRNDSPSGVIRAYDARTGALRWAWDASPPGYQRPPGESGNYARGTPNAWFVFSADEANDIIYLGTGGPALDLYGGLRNKRDFYGSSVVALRASTGEYLWHFQTVHHDLWDYDVDSQPGLFTLHTDKGDVPALVQSTKVGHVFILDRKTGKPLFPVEERPVPQTDVQGEITSPTQPFPVMPKPLYEPYKDLFTNRQHSYGCFGADQGLRFEGVFTPPSLTGGVSFPGPVGGTEWGGVSVDPLNQILILSQNQMPFVTKLIPKSSPDYKPTTPKLGDTNPTSAELEGAPYAAKRTTLPGLGLFGYSVPCLGDPAGEIIAINLSDGSVRWRKPLGSMYGIVTGSLNGGGSLLTAGGVVFIGASTDGKFRALNIDNGQELWTYNLPAPAVANPMTYSVDGEQYVVIAAGGHSGLKTKLDDKVIAFKLH